MVTDRRQFIIEAASKSFAMFGYKATTMEQIAKIANVGKGTIYTFFANKEELFQEIMNRMILEMKSVAERIVDPNRNFFDNLYSALDRLLDFRDKHELAIKLSQEVSDLNTQMASEGARQIEAAIVGYIRQQVDAALAKGEIKPCDPEVTAYVILKLYIALTADWKKHHPPLEKDKVAELMKLYLQKGLAPSE